MPNYRQNLSRTLNSSLQDGPEDHETNVQRLRAFSVSTDDIIGPLYRLKFDLDSSVLQDLIIALAERFNCSRALAELAVSEHLNSTCTVCQGRREIKDGNQVVITCHRCNGTGLTRHSDRSRAHYLKCSMGQARQYSKILSKLASTLGTADRALNDKMNLQLTE